MLALHRGSGSKLTDMAALNELEEGSSPPTAKTAWSIVTIEIPKKLTKIKTEVQSRIRSVKAKSRSRPGRDSGVVNCNILVDACSIVGIIIRGAWKAVMFLNQSAWKIFGPFILMPVMKWEGAFVLSCLAVVFDPLFFYVPIVDDTKMCLTTDKTLKIVALVLRELTDFLLLTHLIAELLKQVNTDYPEYDHDSHSEPNHHQKKKHDDDDDLEVGHQSASSEPHMHLMTHAKSESHITSSSHTKTETYELNLLGNRTGLVDREFNIAPKAGRGQFESVKMKMPQITEHPEVDDSHSEHNHQKKRKHDDDRELGRAEKMILLQSTSEPHEKGLTHAKTDSHLGSTTHTKKENFEHKPGRRKHDTEYEIPEAGLVQWINKKMPEWLTVSIVIKILALVPVPQVAVLVGFFRICGNDFLVIRKFLNISLALQYLPRVGQIYLNRSNFRMAGKFAKPSFNFFLYVLASHVLGAYWYFFAIQRETSCWYKACRKTPGCAIGTYKCGGGTPTNITLLNQLCPINPTNSTIFDFGIFADILESGNIGSDKFMAKLFYSLWWGLKNLSNFGTNLETSNYLWENCFAILICIIGMLLFLYLIGNVQLYITSATEKSLEKERARKDKIEETYEAITKWTADMFHDEDEDNGKREQSKAVEARKKIKQLIKGNNVVEKNLTHAVDVTYFLNHTTPRIKIHVSEYLGLAALKKIPFFRDMKDDTKLKELCHALEPEVRNPIVGIDDLIIEGEPLNKMFFILRGQIRYRSPGLKTKCWLGDDEIMGWALRNWTKSYYDDFPKPDTSTKPSNQAKVEALGLDARTLLRFLIEKVQPDSPEMTKHVQQAPSISGQTKCAEGEYTSWEAPKNGRVKLNCSHLWDPVTKKAYLGFVSRDDKGVLLMAKNCVVESCIDEFDAAARSIKMAMESDQKILRCNLIDVECDHQLVVNCLRNWGEHKQRVIRKKVRQTIEAIINQMTSKFKEHNFMYKSNVAARVLADNAKTPQNCGVWTRDAHPPGWLQDILNKEKPPLKSILNSQEPPKVKTDQFAEPQTPGGAKGTAGSKSTKTFPNLFGGKSAKPANTAKVDVGGEAASNSDNKITTMHAQPST